ncbi:MAG TPA: glycosyl hydrolase, partial [Mobilitalea sp.]|nr:glycosyl hydrolase [Mobilitalea sp.]
AEYEIMIGASSSDIRLSDTVYIQGTRAPLPYIKENLPSYFSGKINNVTTEEYEELLGHEVPEQEWNRKEPLGYNDIVAQCRYAKGGFARFAYHCIQFAYWFLKKTGKRSSANLIMMSVYNMPFRGIARLTGGLINMPMLDGILMIANGHFFRGLHHLLKERKRMLRKVRIKSVE